MKLFTTVLDVAGLVALVVGAGIIAGVGAAVFAAGAALLALSWALGRAS